MGTQEQHLLFCECTVADPALPRPGDANSKGGDTSLIFWPIFLEDCIKTKKIGNLGWGGGSCTSLAPSPPYPPLNVDGAVGIVRSGRNTLTPHADSFDLFSPMS